MEDRGHQRRIVWARDRGRCAECGVVHGRTGAWDVDHVVPLERGGENRPGNLQTLCRRPCHAAKTAREARARHEGGGDGE